MLLLNFYLFKKISVAGMKVLANLEKKVQITELTAVEARRTTSKTVCWQIKIVDAGFWSVIKLLCFLSFVYKTENCVENMHCITVLRQDRGDT